MIPIPFRRIFVFQPELLSGGTDVRQPGVAEEIVEVLQVALAKGADAIYARTHTLADGNAIPLLRLLGSLPHSMVPNLIVPAVHAKQAPHFTALHYRSGETWPEGKRLPGIPFSQSCHRLEEVIQAQKQGFDFVFFSPVFSTASHPDTIPQGLDNLRSACATSAIPVFALGGITSDTVKSCLDAGAHGIAATRLFMR